jgi:hypothetical protein
MGDNHKDPVDHSRTTRSHAGESMKDTATMPALILIGLALVSFVGCLAAFATAHHNTGVVFAALAAAGFAIGLGWLAIEHKRVRGIEERWFAEHPEAHRQRPSS